MNRVKYFYILLAFTLMSLFSYGQELIPAECPPSGTSGNKYGYKDKNTGEMVIACNYVKVWDFSEHIEGLAKVQRNTTPTAVRATLKYGFIDKSGKEIVPLKYDELYQFSEKIEGWALVKIDGKYGFIDKTGKEVIPAKYSNSDFKFSEGLAAVKAGNYYGFIDKTGKEVIPCKYTFVGNFTDGVASAKMMKDDGFIDVAGNFYKVKIDKAAKIVAEKKARGEYNAIFAQIEQANKTSEEQRKQREILWSQSQQESAERERKAGTFSYFAKNYVEPRINEWQKKGEFEITTAWQQRVTEDTRKVKATELLKEAEQAYITERSKNFSVGNMTLDTYDADNQVYLIKNSIHGDWLVSVPFNEAQSFKSNWNSIQRTPKYTIVNDQLVISGMDFLISTGKTYKYSDQASLNYQSAQIAYNFAPIEIDGATTTSTPSKGNQNISTVNLSVGQSDVDVNIPAIAIKNDKTFAVIIANENYRTESLVQFAKNDGETFKKYCVQTLGLPENNIRYTADATLNDIRFVVNWISEVANAFNGEANLIFYYAGHGIPDERSKSAYLLPVDGYGSDVSTGYKIDDLYQQLGKLPAKSVTLFMDACFSGAQRSGEMMASARGVSIKVAPGAPMGNMVVFSAAQGDETAYPHREKGHGMFTYFLLKKLQETKGEVTLGELGDYITSNVRQQSVVVNGKSQTPSVTSSITMNDKWRGMKFK